MLFLCARASRRITGWQSTMSPVSKVRTLVAWFWLRNARLRRRPSASPTMRSVTGMSAQRRRNAAPGTPRRGSAYCTEILFVLLGRVVGIDDARHQRVPHHVLRAELGEGDAAHALEDPARLVQPALLAAREIDLRHVAVHHRLGAEADAREEHLHLLGRGVLRLVEDDEGMVERAAAHVGERRELDRAALEQLAGLLEAHKIEQRVIERPQI